MDDLGRRQGKNILLCSHLLPDVEKTCDHVVVLVEGRTVLQGSIAELTAAEAARIRVVVEKGEPRFAAELEAAGFPNVPSKDGGRVVTLPVGTRDADDVCRVAHVSGVVIRSIEPVRSTLEEVFLRAVDGDATGSGGPNPRDPKTVATGHARTPQAQERQE